MAELKGFSADIRIRAIKYNFVEDLGYMELDIQPKTLDIEKISDVHVKNWSYADFRLSYDQSKKLRTFLEEEIFKPKENPK